MLRVACHVVVVQIKLMMSCVVGCVGRAWALCLMRLCGALREEIICKKFKPSEKEATSKHFDLRYRQQTMIM